MSIFKQITHYIMIIKSKLKTNFVESPIILLFC